MSRLNGSLAGVGVEAGARADERKKYQEWKDKSYCLLVGTS